MPKLEETPTAAAPSQADVLAENDALKARLRQFEESGGQSPALVAALARATAAEAKVAELQQRLLTLDDEVQARATRIACAHVAAAGISRMPDNRESKPSSGGQTATEKAIAARKAAGLKDPVTV